MSHFVYIIYSSKVDVYYKGESFDPYNRLIAHNLNLSTYTSGKGPWELVYIEELGINRKSWGMIEKYLKSAVTSSRKFCLFKFSYRDALQIIYAPEFSWAKGHSKRDE